MEQIQEWSLKLSVHVEIMSEFWLDKNDKTPQATAKNRMASPFQLCFLQFAQTTVLFQD
jgi:hypothetical protein